MSNTPLNILSGQLKKLSGLIEDINESSNTLMTANSESKEENETLDGLLENMRVSVDSLMQAQETQTTLYGRLNELNKFSKLLHQENLTLKQEKEELQSLSSKQQQLINSLQTELTQLPLPQTPLMTTHDDQELLILLENKNDLIQQQATIEERDTTIESLRVLIDELDR